MELLKWKLWHSFKEEVFQDILFVPLVPIDIFVPTATLPENIAAPVEDRENIGVVKDVPPATVDERISSEPCTPVFEPISQFLKVLLPINFIADA